MTETRSTPSPKTPETRPETDAAAPPDGAEPAASKPAPRKVEEIGGPKGPEPTRFGDWSVNGRCIDF
ncbi:MAG: DUF1674 domain-containing protein [Alphaproteobacteria bacterium]